MRPAPPRPAPARALALALAAVPPLALSACAGAGGGGPAGTWIGRLQTVAGQCPDAADSDLVVSDRHVTFVPGDGVLTLSGARDKAAPNALHAELLGRDMNHHPLPMVFDATFADGTISGRYGTPSCRATIAMHRPTHTALERVLGD